MWSLFFFYHTRVRQATRVECMPGFSTLTPYYSEEVILSIETLCSQTQDGVTTLEYLQTLFPQQWTALVERVRREMPNVSLGAFDFPLRRRGSVARHIDGFKNEICSSCRAASPDELMALKSETIRGKYGSDKRSLFIERCTWDISSGIARTGLGLWLKY